MCIVIGIAKGYDEEVDWCLCALSCRESSAPKGSSSLHGQVLKEYIHLVTSSGSSPPLR